MDETIQTEAGVVADLTRRAMAAEFMNTGDGRTFLVTPEGFDIREITDPHDMKVAAPIRIEQKLTLQTKDSLRDYVLKYKGADTVMLADVAANRIAALLDYHGPEQAAFVSHVAHMQLTHSVEWKLWTSIDEKLMAQAEFARFLEENVADIAKPAGADLIEVARDLQAVRGANIKSVVRTNGEAESFDYSEGTDVKTRNGTVEIPKRFELSIPVYYGEPPVTLIAFLRWQLIESTLVLGVRLHRVEHVRQAAFEGIVRTLADEAGVPALFGKLGG